jgi:Xaa-Pro dipeptidase
MSLLVDFEAEIEKSKGRPPKPPTEEQEGRLERARKAMAELELDALLLYGAAEANADAIRYLAGYVHVFPGASSLFLLPLEGKPVLLTDQPWHLEEARKMAFVEDVRAYPNPARTWLADDLRSTVRDAFAAAGVTRGRVGVLPGAMPLVYRDILEAAVPDTELANGAPVWTKLVASPSEWDGANIRRTAQVADEGLAAAVEAAGAGVPEYEVCFRSLERMASLGAEFLHGSGASTHINIGSFSDVISNVRPFLYTGNRLEEGQMFWLDLSACFAGCYTDTDRTVSIGEPTQEQRELYDVTAEMYRVLLAGAKAGVAGGDLWEQGYRVAVEAGLGDYLNHVYLGHTTGITTSSRPVVARGETDELVAGSFLNLEPGIFVPGVGSACVENTVHITESGAEAINRFGLEIHVV